MAFPNHPAKHGSRPIIVPADIAGALLAAREVEIPDAAILAYSRTVPRRLERAGVPRRDGYQAPWRSMWLVPGGDGVASVGVVCEFGIGAPGAALVLEDLIALGVRRIVSIGIAGCLQPEIDFGEVVLCTAALRDEGVSHHYLPASRFAEPAPALTEALRSALSAHELHPHDGPSWTTDAVYRETIDEARAYQAEGIITVEMEAAALFAVGGHRGVEVASALVVSDHLLAAERWLSETSSERVHSSLERVLEASVHALGGRLLVPAG